MAPETSEQKAARLRQFIVRIPPDLDDRLTAHAAASERSKAATVRVALAEYLDRAGPR